MRARGESGTRFRFAGSITRIGNCILINAINKTNRKTYHWKRQNISFATRATHSTKLLQRSRSALKSSSTLSGLATFVLICLFSGTRIPDRYGNRVGETGASCYRGRLLHGRFMQNYHIDGEIADSSYIRIHQGNH